MTWLQIKRAWVQIPTRSPDCCERALDPEILVLDREVLDSHHAVLGSDLIVPIVVVLSDCSQLQLAPFCKADQTCFLIT
jgi:hypothetical protein